MKIYVSSRIWTTNCLSLNCCNRVTDITSFLKHLGNFSDHTLNFYQKFGAIPFKEYVTKGIFHPVFYGDLIYKLSRVRGSTEFIASGTKIVKRLRRQWYDLGIINKTICLVLVPSTVMYRLFLKHCTLTNKVVGDYMTGLVQCLRRGDKVPSFVPSDC